MLRLYLLVSLTPSKIFDLDGDCAQRFCSSSVTLTETDNNFVPVPVTGLTQFDPSLGNLLTVVIRLRDILEFEGTLTNNSETPGTFATGVSSDLLVEVGDLDFDLDFLSANFTSPLAGVSEEPENSADFNLSDQINVAFINTDTVDLSSFIGTDALPASCSQSLLAFNGGSDTNFTVSRVIEVSCSIEVTYTFEENEIIPSTPEPATFLGIIAVSIAALASRTLAKFNI
ncbi:MAG: choice-of-anchor E domain-containing protein [Crocosphaera sp.]|nr:choice-of-anchor E domain-containing protein [Crocosphaera sp.]